MTALRQQALLRHGDAEEAIAFGVFTGPGFEEALQEERLLFAAEAAQGGRDIVRRVGHAGKGGELSDREHTFIKAGIGTARRRVWLRNRAGETSSVARRAHSRTR